MCKKSRFRDIYSWSCHYYSSFSVWQIFTRNSFKNKTDCYAIAICRRSLTNRVNKVYLGIRIRNNSVQKTHPYLQIYRGYGTSARELFFVRFILEWGWCVVVGLRTAVTCLILVQMTCFFFKKIDYSICNKKHRIWI